MTETIESLKIENIEIIEGLTSNNNNIQYGDYVVVEFNGRLRCECIEKGQKIKITKNVFVKTEYLEGTPFDRTYYRQSDGSLMEIIVKDFFNQLKASLIPTSDQPNHDANNQFLLNASDSNVQKLKGEDISKLKDQDLSIDELLKYITEGSSTFLTKNPFSQEKYLKKKLRKHCFVFTVSKPTMQLLAETYYYNAYKKILDCRPDTLAQLLYYSEIGFNSKVLLVEHCEGLVAAALFEKITYYSSTENTYKGGFLCHLNASNNVEPCKIFKELQFKLSSMENNYQKYPWNEMTLRSDSNNYNQIVSRKYDSLVVATKHDNPYEIIEQLYNFVLPSSPIIIYHQYREPLVECYVKLKKRRCYCVDIVMTETWTREYQVAQNRTHPLNMMDGAGGYLLRARKIVE